MRFICFILLLANINANSEDGKALIRKFCREKERLITSKEIDEYLVVDVEIHVSVRFDCYYCNQSPDQQQAKTWYWQDSQQSNPEKEVEFGMENNKTLNRIKVTPNFSLVIKDVQSTDAGIYRCFGCDKKNTTDFNFRLEPSFKDDSVVTTQKGNLTDWEEFRMLNFVPVTTRFAVSNMDQLAAIRNDGIILEITVEWSPWGPCEQCIRTKGIQRRTAYCRIKRRFDKTRKINNDSKTVQFFRNLPLIPCRSMLINKTFPIISEATRNLPEYILEETCERCNKTKKVKKNKFKYMKRFVLTDGGHLSLPCPEATLETKVIWKKDAITLEPGKGHSFHKKDKEERVFVDSFFSLYFIGASKKEEGNYTCYVDGVKMMQVQISIISKTRLLSEAFFRHLGYLGFIFLLTSFCYCAGLKSVWRRRHEFEIQTYDQVMERRKHKRRFFLEDGAKERLIADQRKEESPEKDKKLLDTDRVDNRESNKYEGDHRSTTEDEKTPRPVHKHEDHRDSNKDRKVHRSSVKDEKDNRNVKKRRGFLKNMKNFIKQKKGPLNFIKDDKNRQGQKNDIEKQGLLENEKGKQGLSKVTREVISEKRGFEKGTKNKLGFAKEDKSHLSVDESDDDIRSWEKRRRNKQSFIKDKRELIREKRELIKDKTEKLGFVKHEPETKFSPKKKPKNRHRR